MVMPVNNSALLGGNAVTDVSRLSTEFRDGLQLKQEYEQRKQQKALNDLMSIPDFNERIKVASQHKYAGALVPMVQQYEEARQKAALDNLKTTADINKTYGETGKLQAEAGKIGAETDGVQVETATDIKDYISAAAVTQDPQAFGLSIGELYKRGVLTQDQTASLLNMVRKDPATVAQLMQRMAMANPEIAKVFKPELEQTDLGNRIGMGVFNPMTGQYEGVGDYQKGISPDNLLDNETSRVNAQTSANASMYGADQRYKGQTYATDVASQDRRLKLNQDGQIEWFKAENKAKIDAANAQTSRMKATSSGGVGGGANRKPASILKMEGEYQKQLQDNAHTMRQTANWMEKIAKGKLPLGIMANSRNALANMTGISSLGEAPAEYAEFNAYIKDLATKALRLNAGAQTDSDYKHQLDAMISGDYIPRDKDTAIRLLSRIQKDFESANKGIYRNYKNIKSEYGKQLPAYDANQKKPKASMPKKVSIIANKWFN